jgi:hypothetical protein
MGVWRILMRRFVVLFCHSLHPAYRCPSVFLGWALNRVETNSAERKYDLYLGLCRNILSASKMRPINMDESLSVCQGHNRH